MERAHALKASHDERAAEERARTIESDALSKARMLQAAVEEKARTLEVRPVRHCWPCHYTHFYTQFLDINGLLCRL